MNRGLTHYTSDLRHCLGPDGALMPPSGAARKFGEFLVAIVTAATAPSETARPIIECSRVPKRRRCAGTIRATVDPESQSVLWECATCGTAGVIHHWQQTLWDCRRSGRAL